MEIKKIREYKSYFLCQCPNPEHTDKHPSAILWKDTGILRCMGCDFVVKVDLIQDDTIHFAPNLLQEEIKHFPLSKRAIEYLTNRNVFINNEFLVSPEDDSGVAILQRSVNRIVGMSIRLFVPLENNMRYIFQGKKMPYSGDLTKFYEGCPLVAFEKTFAWLHALELGMSNVAFVSTNGTKSDWNWWLGLDLSRIVFIFDNDIAGARTRNYLRSKGANAFISSMPTDELGLEELRKLIRQGLKKVLC